MMTIFQIGSFKMRIKLYNIKRIFFTFFLLIFSIANVNAKEFTIKEIEAYLSSLDNFYAKFDQIVPGESYSKGEVYIKKPGRFLWQYLAPNRAKIVSNGGLVYFVDQESGQTTQIPAVGFLFTILSKKDVKLNSKNVTINSVDQKTNRITIRLTAKVDDEEVPVALIFEKKNGKELALQKVISKNQLNQTMIISLYDYKKDIKINRKIFKIDVEEDVYKN